MPLEIPRFRTGCQTPQVGPLAGGGRLLATGQAVHPAGEIVTFAGRPVDLALSPDGKSLYVKSDRGLVVISTRAWKIRQELPFPAGGGSMHGIVVSRDSARVYATTAQDRLCEAMVASDGSLAWARQIVLPGPGGSGNSDPCGLALAPDGTRAYVCLSRNNSLAVVDLKTGVRLKEIPVGVAPWGVALSPDGHTAYVTDWGGRQPRPGERTAPSSGTPTLVDARGVAASGAVSIVDLATGRETASIASGLHPCDLALTEDGRILAIANANSDTVSVLDTTARRVVETIRVRPDSALPFGSAPTGLALGKEDRTLYVTDGGNNAIAVVALPPRAAQSPARQPRRSLKGFIPTGWYPGAVVTDGRVLFVADVKGTGAQIWPAGAKGWNSLQHLGAVERIPIPTQAALQAYTPQVLADARIPAILRARKPTIRVKPPVPVPEHTGDPSVFTHVVYVIKENRTYDQVLGDIQAGNGDPALCIYGRNVTPNAHALARRYVLLDNFYCNGVLSA
ncbi:MAG TPA: bifunctional YncE family protein/alkaline phosphatase family protein, partial [Chthonomonadaceae bacterium]|nr:bifunctional YncE family protein/alkaline phosphatase family protein [Chthonomonadaceae bacterium]